MGPTLLELAGLEAPAPEAPDEGRSLTASWREGGTSEALTALPRFSEGNLYGLPAALLEDGSWRFFLRANGTQELYDVVEDSEERNDLSRDHPEVVERYRRVLEPRLAELFASGERDGPQEISPETLKALRALGYVQ